jgi:type II secretion system protein J
MKIVRHNIQGFTLVEVLVSLSIFTFVTTAAVGVLLVMIDANRKSQNTQIAMTNLSFALDSMTRDIRTGTSYYCANNTTDVDSAADSFFSVTQDNDCSGGNQAFAFTESGQSLTSGCSVGANDRRVGFRLNNGVIERSLCGIPDWQTLTSSEVTISTLDFVVTGSDSSSPDTDPPLVTIYIEGSVSDVRDADATFSIQTTVTQQLLDI